MLTKYSLKVSAINLESIMLLSFTDISVILVDLLFLPVSEFILLSLYDRSQFCFYAFYYLLCSVEFYRLPSEWMN